MSDPNLITYGVDEMGSEGGSYEFRSSDYKYTAR